MSHEITRGELLEWCSVPLEKLEGHPQLKMKFRLVADSAEMGRVMARELVDVVKQADAAGRSCRAIVPCGPKSWYEPFCRMVNQEKVSLRGLTVFHMDECLDWQGRLLPKAHPYNFRSFMEEHFYAPVDAELAVPEPQRVWLTPAGLGAVTSRLAEAPVDITLGGWGQDGHLAYNQARRNPYSRLTLEELRNSRARVQENNPDTVLALAQRTFGSAYQLVPPMSVTLGVSECLSAGKVRVFSDTGSWKQTALRVALFSPPTAEYPMTLLGEHADALVTATRETADHPVARHPEWDFTGESGYFDE